MKPLFPHRWIGVLLAAIVLTATSARAQDGGGDLAAARDLYASAAYDDALAVLNKLRATEHGPAQARAIEQYRAFCLLALGRSSDAEQAIEAVVAAEPSYHPSDSDASPRIRSAFTTVRRRMLPTIIQQQYAQAKAAFDRKDWAAAAGGFRQVLTALGDQDVAAEAQQPPLVDLKMLAIGFEELAAKAAAPPPIPTPPPAPAPPVVVAPPAPLPPRVYTVTDTNVLPPVPLNQSLPAYPGQVLIPRSGKIEVVIDETGAVETASMTATVSTAYDNLAIAAAKNWRFRPATLDGTPVKYRKVVQVTIRKTT
jgi:tetratricopeptide (TPR) repeat protein